MHHSHRALGRPTIFSQDNLGSGSAPESRQNLPRLDNLPNRNTREDAAVDLHSLAQWMDSAFKIPGLPFRFGLDSVFGLVPGAGDLATSLVAIYILQAAHKHGVPRITLARMTANIAVDTLVGAIPFLGDIFDVYWKSNQRNVRMLHRHLDASPSETRKLYIADHLFIAGLVGLIVAMTIGSLVVGFLTLNWFTGFAISDLAK